jgi:LmbE family N-acetylglucosaminyl deacetylase
MTDEMPRSVMIIAAHPDDPEFGCGGTVAKWVAEGREVLYVLCTSGDKASRDPNLGPGEMATIREREQIEAAKALGVRECIFLRHVDGELEPTLAFRKEIALLLRQFKPHTVVTHDPWLHYQIHPDHRAVGTAVLDAIAAARDIWYFPEQLSNGLGAHRVKELYLFRAQEPNHWIDVGETIEMKLVALAQHASQVERIIDLRDRIKRGAEMAGRDGGLALAEAFRHIELP